MLILTYILFIIFSACFARHVSDVVEDYKNRIDAVDQKFYLVFLRIIRKTPIQGLDAVGSLFGYISGISLAVYLIGIFISQPDSAWTIFLLSVFFYALAGWFGVKWFTKPKRFSVGFLREMLWIALFPMLMPLINVLTGVEYVQLPYSQVMRLIEPLGITPADNIWLMGLTVSGFMLTIVLGYWIAMTAIFAPIAASGWALLFVVVKSGQLIDRIWKDRALTPICFAGLMLVAAYGHFN